MGRAQTTQLENSKGEGLRKVSSANNVFPINEPNSAKIKVSLSANPARSVGLNSSSEVETI